jgi:CBS domain-containing protein
MDTDALDAARLLAEHRLPGIVVTDAQGRPTTVLPASQVVRFLVPQYVQDDPALAGVLSEPVCDRVATTLRGRTVRDMVPDPPRIPAAAADDTIIEVAAIMARFRSPLVVVTAGAELVGVITASRLLQATLQNC